MAQITEEQAGLAIAEATNCGLGDTGPDGIPCRILCDNPKLDKKSRFETCECRIGARAVLKMVYG